ncbi:MAG: aminotransferase class V-fold PLP-dependent enzyme [Planctomycetes bacterium]|nr:aminotransferase class V-fold PLP-dependent enzyme [Planctomycetota bacterium]
MDQDLPELPAILGGKPLCPNGPPGWPYPDPAIQEALAEAYRAGRWGRYHGEKIEELQARLGTLHGRGIVELCSSGTAAVELALRGLKAGAGDEVILAGYDFKGNFQNVLIVGAVPVLVDVHPGNWNLDAARMDAALGPKTRGILVSHLHGGVAPMPAITAFAEAHALWVLEDAAQMPGARVYGRRAGTWGHVGVLSFGGSKLLCAGRGGALLTDDEAVSARIRIHVRRGSHAYPLSELQAAVLLPQLGALDAANARRSERVAWLGRRLASQSGLRLFENPPSDSKPGYYKVGFQYDPACFEGLPREAFSEAMRVEGVALDPGLRGLHRVHAPSRYRKADELLNASEADRRVLTLHHPVLLGTEAEMESFPAALAKIRAHAGRIRERMKC